tara:strand:+ start:30 stop:602 length:573 start_codon:yes stop_codon:yes gene_type:complete
MNKKININSICSIVNLVILAGLYYSLISTNTGLIENKPSNKYLSVFKIRNSDMQVDLNMFSIYNEPDVSNVSKDKIRNIIFTLQLFSVLLFISLGVSIIEFVSQSKSLKNISLVSTLILIILLLILISVFKSELPPLEVEETVKESFQDNLKTKYDFGANYYILLVLMFLTLVNIIIYNFNAMNKMLKKM